MSDVFQEEFTEGDNRKRLLAAQVIVELYQSKNALQLEMLKAQIERSLEMLREGVIGEKRTPMQWCEKFDTVVIDPDGWRSDMFSFQEPITAEDFARRWNKSTARQPGSKELQEILQRIGL